MKSRYVIGIMIAALLTTAGIAGAANSEQAGKLRNKTKVAVPQFENGVIDNSANLINLQNFYVRTEAGGPKKIFVWGDAGANPGAVNAAICRGQVMALIEEYGLAGTYGSQVNLNPNMTDIVDGTVWASPQANYPAWWVSGDTYNTGDFVRSLSNQNGYKSLVDGNVGNDPVGSPSEWERVVELKRRVSEYPSGWVGLSHALIGVDANITFVQSNARFYNMADTVGMTWLSGPLGGTFDIYLHEQEGPTTLLASVDGYSVNQEYDSYKVQVPRGRYRVSAVNTSDKENVIIGPINYDSTSEGVLVMYSYVNGGVMSQCAPTTNELHDFVADMDPDLFIYNFGDLGQDSEAVYRDNIATNMMPFIVSALSSPPVVLCNGMNYQFDPTLTDFDIEEEIIRDACVKNHWAYYDARRHAGSFTNTLDKGWVGDDPVLLTNEGQLAYARPLLVEMGMIGPRHAEPDWGYLYDEGPLAAIYVPSHTVTNQLIGFPDSYENSGTVTIDRAGASITTTGSGIYRINLTIGSSRDLCTADYSPSKNGELTTYAKTLTMSPTRGFSADWILMVPEEDPITWEMWATECSANTFPSNVLFRVEQVKKDKTYVVTP